MDRPPHEDKSTNPSSSSKKAEPAKEEEHKRRRSVREGDCDEDEGGTRTDSTSSCSSEDACAAGCPDLEVGRRSMEQQEETDGGEMDSTTRRSSSEEEDTAGAAGCPDLEVGRTAQKGDGNCGGETSSGNHGDKDLQMKAKLRRMGGGAAAIDEGEEAAALEPQPLSSSPPAASSSSSVPLHPQESRRRNDGVEAGTGGGGGGGRDAPATRPASRTTTRPGAVAVRGPGLSLFSLGEEYDPSPSPPVRPAAARMSAGRLERGGSTATATTMATDGTASLSSSSLFLNEPVAAYVVQDSDMSDDGNDDNDNDDETNSTSAHTSSRSLRRNSVKLEKIRSEILAAAAAAEAVPVVPPTNHKNGGLKGARRRLSSRSRRKRRQRAMRIVAAVTVTVVVVAVVVGVSVALTRRPHNPHPAPTPAPGSDVAASLAYTENPQDGAFAKRIFVEARGGALFTQEAMSATGTMNLINCMVKPCAAAGNGTLCVSGREYVPGCCLGSHCSNETKCGDACPKPPDSCYLTHPDNVTCTEADCYTCPQDLYELSNYVITLDCLQGGTSVRKSNGQPYKWAIACGSVEQGGLAHRNQAFGQYQCAAARIGAGYPDGGTEGILTDPVSCHYLALAECGCGPADMNSLDLPMPTAPCPANGTCPFRCEDPGSDAARLCRAFPGNVTWWEGHNSLGRNWFHNTGVAATSSPGASLRIYLKEGST